MSRTVRAKVLTVPNAGRVELIGAQDEVIYPGILDPRARGARHRPAGRDRDAAGRRTRSRRPASSRPARSASACASAASSPPRRACAASICASTTASSASATSPPSRRGYVDPPTGAVPLQGRAGHRPGHRHEAGREPARVRRGAGRRDGPDHRRIAGRRRRASGRPTSRSWSRRRSAASPGRCSRPSPSCWWSASSAWACAPGWWWRCRSRWCWPSPSWSCSITGISLQRISLGALIIALGLLVDDAMIAVEMMVARLEAGDTLRKAATARLHLDRLPDADRHAGDGRGLHSDRAQQQRRGRIHLHAVRRDRRRRCWSRGSSRCCSRRCSA